MAKRPITYIFKLVHEPDLGLFYADVKAQRTEIPWGDEYERQIALGKSKRWANTSANRVMKAFVEEQWKRTDAYADIVAHYPQGTWKTMGKWQRYGIRTRASVVIQISDRALALKFKLTWHDRTLETVAD